MEFVIPLVGILRIRSRINRWILHKMKAAKPTKTADGIPVYCGFTHLIAPDDLKRHPKAFTEHSRAQRALIGEIIEGNGWREPVTVAKRTGHGTRGWARVL